jgi:hypothetical protein
MNELRTINPEQLAAFLRTAGQVIGGIVAYHGFLTEAQWALYFGAFTTLALTGWGMFARSDKNLISSAANVPVVERVVVPPTIMAKSETLQENPSVTTHSHWLAAIFVGSLLFLGGCQTAQAPLPSPVVGTVVGVLPDQIRDKIEQGCGYVATGQTILDLVSAFGGPTVPGIVNQIVAEVCTAVTRRSSVRGSVATVRGVRLRGSFVR